MYKDLVKDRETYSLDFPKTMVPSPIQSNYEDGFINRYFAQKINDPDGFVFEIDLQEYNILLQNPYWVLQKMIWRISGPINTVYNNTGMLTDKGVILSNLASISIVSEKIKNINLYLPNPLQFHK